MSRPTHRYPRIRPFTYGAITHYGQTFQTVLLNRMRFPSWAVPISLATTFGISVDFCSSAYLDVSVQQVRS